MKHHNIAKDGTWRYTNKHLEIPVAPGETWKVGNHLFVCGDIEGRSTLNTVLEQTPPTLIYADPPWGAGLARSYRTKAGVDNGSGRPVDYNALIHSLISPARQAQTVAYVENGVRQEKALLNTLRSMGAEITGRWDITYYGTKPAILVAADFRESPAADHPDFNGLDDGDTPRVALCHRPIGTVLDPCAGRGLTARSAETAGWKSVNHELSPYRLAEAIASIASMTGLTPERVIYG